MDKKIKQISQDIQKGKQLEENIPVLFNYMADHYQITAEVRLAMHYFTLYESYCDDEYHLSTEAGNAISKINNIIYDNILQSQSGTILKEAIFEIDAIRQDIMKHVKALTAYTDMFQNFEYVLNRLEYRFEGEVTSVDEEEFSKEILRFIFDSEDNLLINERIKEIIGQLPVRITKQKYFEILKESLSIYLGADGSSFDTFIYILRTCAMINHEEDMAALYPDLWDKTEHLLHLEYKDITFENYDKAVNTLKAATLFLETEISVYFELQEIINEVYTMLLCSAYSGMVLSDFYDAKNAANSIISDINSAFILKEKKDISVDLLAKFTDLEGVQEELAFETDVMENAFYEIGENQKAFVKSLMLEQSWNVLHRALSLLSNSLFIEFDTEKEETTVDENRIEKEVNALESELTSLFAGHDRMVGRAVMANTISKVPVFFNGHKDVMDYVIYSLERCLDAYEKAACIEIINDIISG